MVLCCCILLAGDVKAAPTPAAQWAHGQLSGGRFYLLQYPGVCYNKCHTQFGINVLEILIHVEGHSMFNCSVLGSSMSILDFN